MAYVDHAFSITDEDIMMDSPFAVNNRPPFKEIALAVALLVFGTIGIVVGIVMASNRVGGDRAHGTFLAFLFPLQFCPSSTLIFCLFLENFQGCFSLCWEVSCLFRVSITRGLPTTLIRVSKASPSPTYPLSKSSYFQQLLYTCTDFLHCDLRSPSPFLF